MRAFQSQRILNVVFFGSYRHACRMLKSTFFKLFFLLQFAHLLADDSDFALRARAEISCPAPVKLAQEKGDFKAAELELRSLIQKNPRSDLYLLLAVNYLLDQQEEAAFKAYMQCLEIAPVKSGKKPSPAEQELYDALFSLYLDKPQELEVEAKKVMKAHPDSRLAQYFLAASFANQRQYEPFFYLFYQSYTAYPDNHMAHKTKGVVASLLFQRSRDIETREKWRRDAIDHLKRALALMPKDKGLHRMLLTTASDKDRTVLVELVIRTIVDHNIVIGRQEIPYYVNHALMVQKPELAQLLIDKAKSWYEYSRIIEQMQTQIDQQKK